MLLVISPSHLKSLFRLSVATPVSRYARLFRVPQGPCLYAQSQIVPLLSQSSHSLPASIDTGKLEALTKRVQFGGDEVVKAKDGAGSATLSMAYAGAEFATKVIKALAGEKGIVAPSYVHLDADKEGGAVVKNEIGKELDYFSTNIQIGVNEFRCVCDQLIDPGFCGSLPVSKKFFPLEI
jgi:hypothetical protein